MRLQQKVAIITGGANGIGRAAAVLFASEGGRVVIADRDATQGEACVTAIRGDGGEALFVATDVSRDADVAALVARAVEQFGGVDILLNSAGIDIQGTVVDTKPSRWQRVLEVNLASCYLTCRYAIPEMIRRGGGAIVNIASVQGLYGWPRYAAYAASKAGIIGLTRQIAAEYAPQNIRCNSISPGAVETALGRNSAQLEPSLAYDLTTVTAERAAIGSEADTRNAWSGPLGRLGGPGRPEDIAYAALYLSSDEAAHVSGHNLVVDGGASARIE